MTDIIDQLRKIRMDRGLSQDALSYLSGISSAHYVCRMETGERNPRLEMVARWADALGYRLTLEPKE
jgi:transcriptional regulator with XRE-family HTH domain